MLTPLLLTDEELDALEETSVDETEPSKTYKIDFETGEIYAEWVDDADALKQSVIKAVRTFRDKYLIYSEDYGSEIDYLIGQNFPIEYLQLEVPRLIEEALMIDDRVEAVENFVVEQTGDQLYISFEVIAAVGESVAVEVSF